MSMQYTTLRNKFSSASPSGPTLANIGPDLIEILPMLLGCVWPSFVEFGQLRATRCRSRGMFHQSWANLCQFRSNFGRSAPALGQIRSIPGRVWPNLADVGPKSADVGPKLADLGQKMVGSGHMLVEIDWPNSGSNPSSSAQCGSILAEFVRVCARLARIRRKSTGLGPISATSDLDSAKFGRSHPELAQFEKKKKRLQSKKKHGSRAGTQREQREY